MTADADRFAFADDLGAFLDHGWMMLGRGTVDRTSAARHPTFATVDASGHPQQRTVVLRGAERANAQLTIYTDGRSHKVSDLAANSSVSMHVWEPRWKLQMRLGGTCALADKDMTARAFDTLHDNAILDYNADPAPGTVLDAPDGYTKTGERAHFAVLLVALQTIELMCLAPHGHRRAIFSASDNWVGQWLVP